MKIQNKVYKSKKYSDEKAEMYGKELERIRLKNKDKKLFPEDIIEEAKNKGHMFHDKFIWDNKKCGDLHRRKLAGSLINSIWVEIEIINGEETKRESKFYISERNYNDSIEDRLENGSKGYYTIETVLKDDVKKGKEIHDFKEKILSICDNYGVYKELDNIVSGILDILKDIS